MKWDASETDPMPKDQWRAFAITVMNFGSEILE
jgi:hypothetical protein